MQNVLLIESDERLLRERAHQLSLDGYEVHTAHADQQARAKLAAKPDAVVLCSLSDGPQTLRLLRQLRAGEIPGADARVPVLAVGADDDSSAMRSYRTGADVALPTGSSPLLVTAGLEALARRLDVEQQRRRVRRIGNLTIDDKARAVQANTGRSGSPAASSTCCRRRARSPTTCLPVPISPAGCGDSSPTRGPLAWLTAPRAASIASSRRLVPSRGCRSCAGSATG